jgi:hypothetical protein
MKNAKYYIYRNLHSGGFSIRFRGVVIDRLHTFTAQGVEFKVNESGRQRVLKEGRKNVHAFVVADRYKGLINSDYDLDRLLRIKYNPYTDKQFKCKDFDIFNAGEVVFKNGVCFLALK